MVRGFQLFTSTAGLLFCVAFPDVVFMFYYRVWCSSLRFELVSLLRWRIFPEGRVYKAKL
jgi:hypothetical protein